MNIKELLKTKKYFLFDLDGTLVDLEDLNHTSFQKAVMKFFQKELTFGQYLKYFAGAGSIEGIKRYLQGEGIEHNLDLLKVQESYRDIKRVQLENNFNNVVRVIEGSREYLAKLKSEGKKIVLGTSSAKEFALTILKKSNLFEYFDDIVAIEDVQNSKPAPDIFLKAMERAGGNILESIVFEDSPTGVESAKNSGIDYVVIHTKGRNDEVAISEDFVIENYTVLNY